MPTEVKNRPAESFPPKLRGTDKYSEHDPRMAAHRVTQQQQQQQHREALRLALGSILSPRPHFSSRPSSGSATPSYPFSIPSGSHTPAGTPPSYYPLAHGPNSSEYIHSHHSHLHYPHPHTPSRLGRSNSSSHNSPSGSPENTAPNSSHPSPLPPVSNNLPVPPDIDPLPPAHIANGTPAENSTTFNPPIHNDHSSSDSTEHANRACTPRSKFMQTLQSKSAWDALIHGSFS
jgi:hypothetical protein